ncbi:MAG: hypothetical protein KGL39_24070 [Patescibacteria group bacterium]|nr:hypothetical protein [Patescibacteria group bacterium]
MPLIKTEHLGHEIVYREDGDEWQCWAFELTAPSLRALKEKINKLDAAERRLPSVPVIALDYGDRLEFRTATMLAADGKHVLTTNGKGDRKKIEMRHLFRDTPGNRAVFEQAAAHHAAAKREIQAANNMIAALPAMTPDDFRSPAD